MGVVILVAYFAVVADSRKLPFLNMALSAFEGIVDATDHDVFMELGRFIPALFIVTLRAAFAEATFMRVGVA